jgi:hypothetical protein
MGVACESPQGSRGGSHATSAPEGSRVPPPDPLGVAFGPSQMDFGVA